MQIGWWGVIGWLLAVLVTGMLIGIIGTTYYFRRWRKKVTLLIDTYKQRAREAERIMRKGVSKPGSIEKE
jgi:hypothetical protein